MPGILALKRRGHRRGRHLRSSGPNMRDLESGRWTTRKSLKESIVGPRKHERVAEILGTCDIHQQVRTCGSLDPWENLDYVWAIATWSLDGELCSDHGIVNAADWSLGTEGDL